MSHAIDPDLKIAQDIAREAVETCHLGTTTGTRHAIEIELLHEKMDEMRRIEIKSPTHSLGWILEIATLAKEFECGNCVELACIAFMRAVEQKQFPVELFQDPRTDHYFVVLKREISGADEELQPKTDLTALGSAIICV